jgi:uncharacterized protein RhaS with RHS repeats
MYLTLYRAYDPSVGRWVSRDPMGEDGGINLYAYVGSNPLSRIDPTGLDWIWQQSTGNLYNTPIGSMGLPISFRPVTLVNTQGRTQELTTRQIKVCQEQALTRMEDHCRRALTILGRSRPM